MNKFAIQTPDAPTAIGPYSQAVRWGSLLFLSGQIPLDPLTGKMIEGGIEAQTRQVMQNLQAVLLAANLSMDAIVKTTIYLTDMGDFQSVNEIYSQYFNPPFPARATVQVANLPRGAQVEIDATAVIED